MNNLYSREMQRHQHSQSQLWYQRPHPRPNLESWNESDPEAQLGSAIGARLQRQAGGNDLSARVLPVRGLDQGQIVNGENYLRLYTTYTVAPGSMDFEWMRTASANMIHQNRY